MQMSKSEAEQGTLQQRLKYFGVVSLLPEIFSGWESHGVIARAIRNGTIELDYENPRSYSQRSANAVDDKPYGGGPGMVMQIPPLEEALSSIRQRAPAGSRTILLAPHGRCFNQKGVDELRAAPGVVFICGRYEGIDHRIEAQEGIEVWSVGDYVLSGGELAAMIMIESISRHVIGVLGDEESAVQDSFMTGHLDCPHYTRPAQISAGSVPEVLLAGNHAAISQWRYAQALGRMWEMRPDLVHNLAPLSLSDWRIIFQHLQSKQNT